MSPLQGFLDGFSTQTTLDCLQTDLTISMPTAGMIPGLQYHIRVDDTNPPTTFEYAVVQFQDAGTAIFVNGGAGRGIGSTSAAFHPLGSFVSAVLLAESLVPTFARLDTQNPMAFSSASIISGLVFDPYGLSGAVQPTRYVGATTGGAPTTGGPFLTGDFVLDSVNNVIWLCTGPGSPGTWQNILDGVNTGLGGAVSSLTRWIGATGGGAPLSGTWRQGDVITDRSGSLWVCTQPGAPGTWTQVPPAGTPLGTLGYAQTTTGQAGITAQVDLTSLSVPVTVGAGRRIKITGYVGNFSSTVNTDKFSVLIMEGATTLQTAVGSVQAAAAGGGNSVVLDPIVVLQPTAGAHTYKLASVRNNGTGTGSTNAAPALPAFILVEDIGV